MTKTQLTANQRRVLEWMQAMSYGRIEGLAVKAGQPVCDPRPRLIREMKLDGEHGSHPMLGRDDYVLKAQTQEFFGQMERMRDGKILMVEVRNGLPCRMVFEEEVKMAQPGCN